MLALLLSLKRSNTQNPYWLPFEQDEIAPHQEVSRHRYGPDASHGQTFLSVWDSQTNRHTVPNGQTAVCLIRVAIASIRPIEVLCSVVVFRDAKATINHQIHDARIAIPDRTPKYRLPQDKKGSAIILGQTCLVSFRAVRYTSVAAEESVRN